MIKTAEPEHNERSKRRRISPQAQDGRDDAVKIKKEAFEASTPKLHKADVTDIDHEMEILRRKKLKLLRDSDWLGLHLQEPLKLKYAPTGVDDNIGRRRRLKPGHEARYEKQHMHSSPGRRGYDTLSQVRVAIDGKERRVGISSSAAPPSHGRAPPPMSSQSSEPMLLEGRLGSEASYVARGQSESRQQGRHRSDSHRSNQRAQNAYTGEPDQHEKEAAPPRENLGRLATAANGQPMLHETPPSFSSSSIRKRAEELGCAPYDRGGGDYFKTLSFSPSAHHSSQEKLPQLPRPIRPAHQSNNHDARKKGRLIMPSSPPVLHHPVPRRAMSKVLRTNSIEIASSVAATVGEVPKQTEMAKKEDEMWKNWLDEDATDGSDTGPGPDETDDEQDRQRSITPGVSQYVPRQSPVQECERSSTPGVSEYVPPRLAAEISESLQGRRSSGPSAESIASSAATNGSLAHNAMRISSPVNSTTMSASRTPSAHPQAAFSLSQAAATTASRAFSGSPRPEFRSRISLPLPDARATQRVDDDSAWRAFLRSPSELRFDVESPRPFQKPPIRRPTKQEKLKPKTPDPDAAWKSFVLTNDSDSEGENPAFNSFWKKNEMQTAPAKPIGLRQQPTSYSHASLEVHAPTSMGLPNLPFSRPGTRTPGKLKSHAGILSTRTSDSFNDYQVLGGRYMYADQSQIPSIEDSEPVLDDRSMYANQSHASTTTSSLSSQAEPFKLNNCTGQTIIKGFFKPPQKLRAKAPLGARGHETFKRPVSFGTPQKARKESFVNGLDKTYVQEANRELRKKLWRKKASGEERREVVRNGKEKGRQTKSIWDIPSSDDDYIEDS